MKRQRGRPKGSTNANKGGSKNCEKSTPVQSRSKSIPSKDFVDSSKNDSDFEELVRLHRKFNLPIPDKKAILPQDSPILKNKPYPLKKTEVKVTMDELENEAEDDLDEDFKSNVKPNLPTRAKYSRQATLNQDKADDFSSPKVKSIDKGEDSEDSIQSFDEDQESFIRGYTHHDSMVVVETLKRNEELKKSKFLQCFSNSCNNNTHLSFLFQRHLMNPRILTFITDHQDQQ